MTNILKTFQEEQDKEFDELFVFTDKDVENGEPVRRNWRPTFQLPGRETDAIKSYIHSREEALLKRIGEEVEKMRKNNEEEHKGTNAKDDCSPCIRNTGFNQALDDIKNILK